MTTYKTFLGSVLSRYSDLERRLLFVFAQSALRGDHGSNDGEYVFVTDRSYDFEFLYLMADGLLTEDEELAARISHGHPRQDMRVYRLTSLGREIMASIRRSTHECAPDGDEVAAHEAPRTI